ncbi:MAG: ComEA family DNA-binding protein [Chitinophagales bacterium]
MAPRKRLFVFGLIFLVGCAAVAAEGRVARLQWLPLGEAARAAGVAAAPGAGSSLPGRKVPNAGPVAPAAPQTPGPPSAPPPAHRSARSGNRRAIQPVASSRGTGRSGAAAAAAPPVVGPLDLNLATGAQLEALPGIGPSLARRILEYRQQHGAFRSVEELDRVRGIGPSRLANLAPLVKVAPAGETR